MMDRVKPPLWFWAVAALLLLWGASGVFGFYMSLHMSPEVLAAMSDYDRGLYADRATWFIITYGIAVWASLVGAALLLLRRGWAEPVFIVSLVAVVVMFVWEFGATDLIAVKGVLVAMGFPVVIALIGIFQIWFTRHARARGWIG